MGVKCQNSKRVFFGGVLLLSMSTVLVKAIGLIYKIPMLSYLGSEGMGYFNSAYEIYALFSVIATAGLPVALSVLISGAVEKGCMARVSRIYSAALRIFLLLGIFGFGIMCFFARALCTWIQSENAYACILSISPTVLLICISSAIRGYFQGFQRMLPTAVSQIIEAVGKLVFGLLFASFGMHSGYDTEAVASFAGWGLTLGTALSTLYLIIAKHRFCAALEREGRTDGECRLLNEKSTDRHTLLALALPMTVGASLTSVTKLIDMTMILRGLQGIGYSESAANAAYGAYTTLSLSVFTLLPTLLNSVSLPLVPILSAAISAGDRERQTQMIEASYKLTAFFAIPASLGISIFSHPVLSLIFPNQEESVAIAAPLLSILGVSVFLSCMIGATNSVLHAYRVVKLPILSLLLGALIKLLVGHVLISDPEIGLLGAPISSFFCNATVVLLNFFFSSRFSEGISVTRIFFIPLLNSMTAIGFSFACYRYFEGSIGAHPVLTLGAIGMSALLYFCLSLLSGVLRIQDLWRLPIGKRLYCILERLKKAIFKENKQKIGK